MEFHDVNMRHIRQTDSTCEEGRTTVFHRSHEGEPVVFDSYQKCRHFPRFILTFAGYSRKKGGGGGGPICLRTCPTRLVVSNTGEHFS